jgi:Flp pilus assembly pilin Flp
MAMRKSLETRSTTASRARCAGALTDLLRRFAVESDGDDLVEYALLTTFIGFAGAAAWNAIQTGLGAAYVGWVGAVWNLWEPNDPLGGGA